MKRKKEREEKVKREREKKKEKELERGGIERERGREEGGGWTLHAHKDTHTNSLEP